MTDLVGSAQLGQDGAFDAHGEGGLSMIWRGLKGLGDTAITGVKCGFIVGVFLIRFLEFYYAAEVSFFWTFHSFIALKIRSNTFCIPLPLASSF